MRDVLVFLVFIASSVLIFLTVNGLYPEQLEIEVKKILTIKMKIKEKCPSASGKAKGRISKKSQT